mmetsp:Transcript_20677/g.57711  ORF Transcript_20677/g.57711 Transcript_20677/m.57711 type:complete len:400 (+) Transcript_20677:116-1315(+)
MGAAESRLESPLGLGENPFANVKVAWTPPPAPTAEEQEDRQKEKEMEHGRGKSRHKSPAQRKIEEDAKGRRNGWVYKNERRATPAEVRKAPFQDPPSPKGPPSPKAPHSPKAPSSPNSYNLPSPKGGRRAQSARPGKTLIGQMEDLGKEEAQITREQKLEREKEDFMQRVTTFMAGNVAIRPQSSAASERSSPKLPIVPPVKGAVPDEYQEAWMQKLLTNREEILQALKSREGMEHFVEPKTEEDVREGVARSLGSAYDVFTTFQRTINRTLATGLNEELLQQLLLDDKGHGSRDQQSLQQDWRTVGAAVEGVMQVYINRSNSRFITNGDWVKPRVVDGHGTLAHVYSHGAETMVAQSMVALLYIDTGHLVKVGDEDNTLAAVRSNKNWKPLVPPGTFS